MMDLTTFAPEDFKEHLKVLENQARFYRTRLALGLGNTPNRHHYIITGNEGVGKSEAVDEIYKRIASAIGLNSCDVCDAAIMFNSSGGYESALEEVCKNNILLHIKNAELLSMKGYSNPRTGIEDLCNLMHGMANSIVILTGRRNLLMETVNAYEKAKALFTYIFHFEDMTPDALYQYMLTYTNHQNYLFDPSAEPILKKYLTDRYNLRGSCFRNKYVAQDTLEREIVPRMSDRVMRQLEAGENVDYCMILPEDLPEVVQPDTDKAINKLKSLVGLENVKKQIQNHISLVKLNHLRTLKGIYNKIPPMHMVFTGNPGTGKTTVAKYIGEIYHSIGVLSSGHVVITERTKLVSDIIGGTEKNTMNAINSASGGVLFIDEAYNLLTDETDKRDFGIRVIETLLTYLSADETDMIVILAGYTNEMERMLAANPGMKSRFPYVFNFEDYTPKELMEIGKKVLEKEQYKLTPEAEKKLTKYVINDYDHKDDHFGNGRYITRLITTRIIPAHSSRILAKQKSKISIDELTAIDACDIPEVVTSEVKLKDLDESVLAESLERLDNLISLENVKQALHDFVDISKLRHQQKTLKITPQSLCWDFIGKTGTGKGTVAEIFGRILQGLGILKQGQTVCVNSDELKGDDWRQVVGKAIEDAKDGLLFLDMDSPNDTNLNLNQLRMWIVNKLREKGQTTALVFGQVKAEEDAIAQDLTNNGIASYANTIIFNDYTSEELVEIMEMLLIRDYQLDMKPAAKEKIIKYLEGVRTSVSKIRKIPVNLRTIHHITQTVAHITQLRIVRSGGSHSVTKSDVAHFKWGKRKVGFTIS